MSGAGFVNLHNHSHYSILDGYSRPIEYLKRAAALGQTALALTDHGNLFGAFEFVSAARAMSKSLDKKKHPQEPVWVKPIVGIEAYMAPENPDGAKCKKPVFYSDDPSKRSIDVSSNGAYTHLTLLAVDDAGFHNLIRLSTESFKRENTYYNQRMDMSMLAKWNAGLVATTGCPSGEIQTRLRLGQVKEAYEYAERMSDLFPGHYYVEIMSHAMKKDLERDAIPQLLKLAEDLKLPLLATNDAHYANPGDARRHEEMLCINTNSRGGTGERVYMDTPTEDTVDEWMETHQKEAQDYLSRGRRVPTRFAFSGNDYYLKSYEEMIRQFPEDKFPGAVRNTLEVADMVGDWWAKKPLDLEAIADKYRDDVELAKAGKAFDADYRLPHAGGGTSLVGPVKANKGVTVLGETPSQPAEFKSDPLTQKLIDDGTVALGPYDLSLNKGIRPVIQIPEGWTEAQWFQKKLNDGFVQRRVAKGDSPEILAESKRRLDVEYPVFEGNDFVQYMLVVADYISWAREHGVTVGSGRGCFLPGTRVKGKQGAMRRIEDYAPGDVVQTHDTSYHKVEKVFEYDVEDEDCVGVRLMDGTTIRCTADHMLFAKNKGFTQAQELESGTVLLGPVGRKEPDTQAKSQAGEKWNDAWHREYVVESVAHFRYTGKVYDLQVEGVHNYNVQGVTAHNSVGGSEVAYLMDISRTDPIRHDLLFERFLNPERKSPPDVDTDFKASVRNDVLQYAKDKYGYDNVANIVNFGTFKLKQAFQDIAKIYHADSAQAIKMSKMIPDPIDHGEPTMEDLYDPESPFYPLAGDFREAIEAGGEQWKPIREAAGALVGRVRQTGTHACGVIMCSEPIVNYAPLFWNKNEDRAKENIWTDCMCQWKYQDLEAIGLIKMDFLPLSTLDIVDSVIDNVEQYNEQIDVAASAASRAGDADRAAAYRKRKLEVPDFTDIENDGMDDAETYAMLAGGESDAVFQMGSDGQKDLLKRIRPTEFNDLVAINALYRPGPMAMNAHLQYADRKNGKEPCYVINEELDKVFKGTPMEDILRPTYGLCVPGDEKVLDATTGLHVPIRGFEVGHKTKSWNEETGEWSANVVSNLVHTGMKDCVELTVSNHRKVRVSKTHPLLTPRGWVAAGDLTVGDELAMNDVAMPEIEDKSGLTPDLAWFVGVMLGDGTIPGSKGYPYVTTTDQVIIDELARIAEENFGNIEVTGTKQEDAGGVNGNVYHVMFTNADRRPVGKHDRHAVGYCGDRNTVNQFLARYGYKGKIRMYDKVVTPEVMRGSNEIIRNVVAGMWDTDGTCSKTGLHYTTTSRGLYEGMCQMLDRLGVRVRVSEAPYHNEKRADRVAYRVYPDAEAFRREIVDRLRLKKTAFLSNCVMDHEPAKSMERRPSRFQQEVIEAARELVRNDPSMLSGVDVTDPRIAKNLSLRTLWSAFTGRSFKEYPAKTIAFKQLANSIKNLLPRSLQAKLDTPWRQITAIRSIGEMDCYDITVENDHTFLLDGVISHNCVYQEQIMQISQAMAGYTKGEADSLRKAMGHKIAEEMEANRVRFEDGALKLAKERGYKYSKADLEKFWAFIADFAKYCFNRSHSVSYAINAYETAYLKCHYKPFFWAANLTQNMKNKDKFRKFLRSARDMGLQVESVDVNKSGVGVTAAFDPGRDDTDTITFGFDTASGVNETVAREIVAARNKNGGSFKSFDDFMTHGPESILSAGAITGLADAGAFDCLGVKRKQVADRARWIVDFYKKKRTAVASSSRGLLGMLGGRGAKSTEKSMGEYDLTRDEYSKKDGAISFGPLSYDWATMLAKEKASLGVYASADPLSNAGYGLEVMKKNPSSPYRAISTLEEEARAVQDDSGSSGSNNGGSRRRKAATVRLIGYLVDLAVKRNAKGSVWFSGSVCDESGSIEFRMYSRAIQQRMEETGIGDPKTVISEDTVYDMMCSWSADTGRLTLDSVSEVPIAKADGAVPIIIRMKGEGSLRSAKWRDVAALLSAHPGNVPVAVDLAQASGKVELDGRPARRGVNMLGARVDGSSEFMDGLTALVGDRLCSWSSKGRWDPEY